MHPDLDWAASGAMALTGHADGPPLLAPFAIAGAARTAIGALASIASEVPALNPDRLRALDAPALLGERAAVFGHTRRGTTSVGGTCHLLPCGADGWMAVNLARPEDLALLPAWLGEGDTSDARAFVATRVRDRRLDEVVDAAACSACRSHTSHREHLPSDAPSWLCDACACSRRCVRAGRSPARRRSLLALGRPSVRSPALARRRARDQGREHETARRRAARAERLLRSR